MALRLVETNARTRAEDDDLGLERGAPSLLLGAPAPPARTLVDVFLASVATHLDRIALDDGRRRLTYRQLDEESRRLAARLGAEGIGRGDRVGIRVPDGCCDLYLAVLGVLRAGAAYVPVDVDDPEARAQEVWSEAQVSAVVGRGLRIQHHRDPSGRVGLPEPDDDCWVIFTSGSTGRPKGVAVAHRAAAAFVDAEAQLFSVDPSDRVLAGLSIGFDASCEEMWLAWRHGAALVPAPRNLVRAGTELGPFVLERGVSVLSTVPTLASMLDRRDLSGVRLLILGGESCSDELGWSLAAPGREVWNTYGPTEATVVSTAARVVAGAPVRIGRPIPGWAAAVVDRAGALAPPDEPGELVLGGVGLARYLDPELDRAKFAPLWEAGWSRAYRTGDLVRIGEEGLEFLGRLDGQVKVGGRRIELGEIEARLHAVPGVSGAAAGIRRNEAGDDLLVAWYVGTIAPDAVRVELDGHLAAGVAPVVVRLDALPSGRAGKLDRGALPWPPPREAQDPVRFGPTASYLADLWEQHLGVRPARESDDFFALGGASLGAARVASQLRERYPSFAVAEIYRQPQLGALAARLDALGAPRQAEVHDASGRRTLGVAQLLAGLLLMLRTAGGFVVLLLALDDIIRRHALPSVDWPWLVLGWFVLLSPPGEVLLVAAARRILLGDLAPGRYPRRSLTATKVWFVDRLAGGLHVYEYAGSPWATPISRLLGIKVGAGSRLGTIPSPSGLVRIGAGVSIEDDVDMHGWWIEGPELVVGRVEIGDGARVGTRAILMPGATVEKGAEVEPGTVVNGTVPAGERWSGAPAARIGDAGVGWPESPPPAARPGLKWAYAASVAVAGILPLVALVPAYGVLWAFGVPLAGLGHESLAYFALAPLYALVFIVSYVLLLGFSLRVVGGMIRPGWHGPGKVAWATWTNAHLLGHSRVLLFPLWSTIYTRHFARLAGVPVGPRAELSTAVGLSPLVALSSRCFVADDAVFKAGRERNGWLHLEGIELAEGSFVGNSALLHGGTRLGEGGLVGVQSIPPRDCPAQTSWFGTPAIEFPRQPPSLDAARTVAPSPRLVAGRCLFDGIRILFPITVSFLLGVGMFEGLDAAVTHLGLGGLIALALPATLAAGLLAVAVTALVKWVLIGRYRAGEHPLWSFFVWRDEIVNSCQEVLAGGWLVEDFYGTRLMGPYLRLMGAKVGRDVWIESLNITEFEMVTIGDGAVVNRGGCPESHLFHDRVMRIGPITLGAGATLGPQAAVLPDSEVGERCVVGARAVVLRGERVPPHTRWHGAPVVAW